MGKSDKLTPKKRLVKAIGILPNIRVISQETAIAKRNDQFRVNVINSPSITSGKCVLTASIAAQEPLVLAHILYAVKTFDDFNEDNDPYKEHDFGKITIRGLDVFWKIDYFKDEKMTEGTDDPLTSYQVMTIMIASEY
jgi:hypothetical protein